MLHLWRAEKRNISFIHNEKKKKKETVFKSALFNFISSEVWRLEQHNSKTEFLTLLSSPSPKNLDILNEEA